LIVADTNLIAYLLIPGERSETAERVFRSDPDWAAPLLWRSEFRNVLAFYLRQGLIKLEGAARVWESAEALVHQREFEVGTMDVLRLAVASRCSAYDCEFVSLAQELGAPLVTGDAAVLKAFPKIAVRAEDFRR
jgi:predicted nucleic acid-binding protein